jgi:hypothetical protein
VQHEDGNNPLFHFKRGFSSDVRPFYTWRIVVDPIGYAQLTNEAGAGPDDIDGFFPAYRRGGGAP